MGEQEQFQQPDPLQKMYGVLSQKGYYTKSFDEFKQKYSEPEYIDKLYSVLNRDGLYTKNKDSFYGKYFPTLPQSVPSKEDGNYGTYFDYNGKKLFHDGNEHALYEIVGGQKKLIKKTTPIQGTDYNLIDDLYTNDVTGGVVKKKGVQPKPQEPAIAPTQQIAQAVPVQPAPEHPEENPIDLAKQANELSQKTRIGQDRMGATIAFPDDEAIAQSQQVKDKVKTLGFDAQELYKEHRDIPERVYQLPGFSKQELLKEREENPESYHRKLAAATWQANLNDALAANLKSGELTPEQYEDIKLNLQSHVQHSGSYEGRRRSTRDILQYIDQNVKDDGLKKRMIDAVGMDRSYTYGTDDKTVTEAISKDERKTFLDENQIRGLQYLEDVQPDVAKGYSNILIDKKKIENNPAALAGWEERSKRLEELGIGLQMQAVTEDINKMRPLELAPAQLEQYAQLNKKYEELHDANAELNLKYKAPFLNDTDEIARELIGQETGGLVLIGAKAGQATGNMFSGVWEAASEPFRSDEGSKINQLKILGESNAENRALYLTQKNSIMKGFDLQMTNDLHKLVDPIINDKNLKWEEKYPKVFAILKAHPTDFQRVPKGNELNITPASLFYSVGGLAAQIAPYIAVEAATGGGASAGVTRKLLSSFTAAMATGFHDTYVSAIKEGVPNPYSHALRVTAINSAAMAGAGTPALVRKLIGGKATAIGELVGKMTDDEIQAVLSKTKTSKIFDAGKALGSSALEGIKGGAKFEAFMGGAKVLNNAISGKESHPEDLAKEAMVGILNFGIFGTFGGARAKFDNLSNIQRDAWYKAGESPELFLDAAKQQFKSGVIDRTAFDNIKENIDRAAEIHKKVPFVNNNGKPLSAEARAELMFLKIQENELKKDSKSDAPPALKEKQNKKLEDLQVQMNKIYRGTYKEVIPETKPQENVTTDQPTGIPTAESGNKEIEPTGVGETNTGLQVDNRGSGENIGNENAIEFAAKSGKHFEYVPIGEIENYKEFDRETESKNDLDALTEDIRKNGIQKPIQLKVDRSGKALIVEGNTRLAAAKRLGIKNIPVEIIEGEFGSINKSKIKKLPELGASESIRRQKELSLKELNGAYSKGFSRIDPNGRSGEAVGAEVKLEAPVESKVEEVKKKEDIKVGDIVDTPFGKLEVSRINKNGAAFFKNKDGGEMMYTPELWGGVKEAPKEEAADVNQEVKTVEDAIKKHDSTENYTFPDMVSDIEHIANESGNPKLLKAVEDYRKEQEYDNKTSGRGDMDAAERAFEAAIRSEEKPNTEQVVQGSGSKIDKANEASKRIDSRIEEIYAIEDGDLSQKKLKEYFNGKEYKEDLAKVQEGYPAGPDLDGFEKSLSEQDKKEYAEYSEIRHRLIALDKDNLYKPFKVTEAEKKRYSELKRKFDDKYAGYAKGFEATPTENPKPETKTPHADFREQILSDLENEKGSEFDFVLDELPLQQSGRKTAVKNIRQGKSTKATKMVEEAIQKMYDEGYVYLNRGRGNHVERQAIPLEHYMEEIRKPLEATEADLHELNTLLGEEAFNDTFDRAFEEITKTQNNETKRNGEVTQTPVTPEGAAGTSPLETKAGKSSSQPDTENTIRDRQGAEPPTNQEQAEAVGGGEGQGIRHADTAETRKEFGLPDYEKKTDTIEAWDAEADVRIKNGEMQGVIEKMQKGEQPSAVETRMMGKYIATLADAADKAPTKENLIALRDAIELSDKVGGSDVGKALRARQGDFLPDDSLSGNLVRRMEAAGVTELTEAQKKDVSEKVDALKKTIEDERRMRDELEQKNKELQAELEIANAKKAGKKNEKKDYKQERSGIKQSIKDKWKKAANDGTLTAVPLPYAKQLASIAPDVAKLMKSYVEEGVTTLVELVDRIHGDVREAIPEIERKDVFDILAGKYNEPKKTKNELMEQMRDLRDEAKYIDQLETLNAGMEPKSERAKVERNRRVKELQEKIKEHDVTKLSQIKKRNEAQLAKIKEQLRTGDFEKKKTVSAIDNLELQKKYPELYKSTLNAIKARENAKHQLDLANLNEEIAAQGKMKAGAGHLARTFRTFKALKAGIDDSGLGVQVLLLGLANPRSFASSLKEHALDAFSAERFERNLAKLHNSDWWPLIEQSGLSVVDPKSLRESEKNDIYNDTYWDKMKVTLKNGKTIDLAPTKPFERAFTSLGNNIRVNIFLKRAEMMMDKGITINNSPNEYKALASVINNLSGRGTMAKGIEAHNDILSAVLWSPRLLASSINVLGLSDAVMPFVGKRGFYSNLTPAQGWYVTKQLVRGIGTGVALMAALSYAFGGDSDLDPTSVTFGTIKIGDYRYTIFGRYNSVVRMIAMSALMVRKTSKGEDILTDNKGSSIDKEGAKFIRGKVNPTVGIAWNLWSRKGYDNKPITLKSELKNALLPMSVDDVLKGLSQDGTKSLLIRGIPSFIGVKVSNEQDFQQSGGAAPKKKPSKPTRKHKTRE